MADAKTLKQEQTALFRYAVIFPLLDERLGQGDQARILDEISAKDYEIPFSTRRKVSRGTAARWLTLYRKGGIVLETTDFNQKMTTDFNQYKCHRI